jgi:hypothetical protein
VASSSIGVFRDIISETKFNKLAAITDLFLNINTQDIQLLHIDNLITGIADKIHGLEALYTTEDNLFPMLYEPHIC